jgi:hypothetical protein
MMAIRDETRKERAMALLKRLQNGPHLTTFGPGSDHETLINVKRGYLAWVDSWILPDLVALVPELRLMRKIGKINDRGDAATATPATDAGKG